MAGYHLDLHLLPLFEGLTAAETDQFLAGMNASVRRYEKGKYILRAEEKNENIGVIVEGEIQVISEDAHGNESVSHSLERGALVGITTAILPDKAMNLSLVATTNVLVLWIPYNILLTSGARMGRIHGVVMKHLLQVFAWKTVIMAEKIQLLSQKTLRERIVLYLQQKMWRQGVDKVHIPGRIQMAKELECNRCALTRELSSMKAEGIISFEDDWMKLCVEKLL